MHVIHIIFGLQSFRFGPEIGFVASCALEFFKNVKKRTLVGNAKDCESLMSCHVVLLKRYVHVTSI